MKKIFLFTLSLLLIASQAWAGFGGYIKADVQTNVTIGPAVSVSDGYTPVTNLDVSTADEAEIIKHAGTSVTDISGNTMTAIGSADGYYYLTITAGQLDTEGRITVLINDDSLCLPIRADFEVVNANVYDSFYAVTTTDYLQVDIAQVGQDDITDNGDGRLEVNVEEIADSAVSTSSAQLGVNVVNYSGSAATSTVAGLPDVNVTYWEDSAITDADGIPDVNTTTIEGGDATDAINTEADNAIVTYKLDHLVAVAESDDPVNDSIIAKMAASDGDWSGFDNSTDSLEAIRDRGDADWSSGAAANPNMLLEAEVNTVTDQTHFTLATGADVDDSYNDQAIVLYDDSNSDYPSIRVINDYTGSTKTVTIDSAPDFTLGTDDSVKVFVTAPGTTAPTASQIVDEWETQSQADPTGFHVNVLEVNGTAQTANDNGADINAILTDTAAYDTDAEYATAIWNAATASYGGAGTYGQAVEDTLADTNELQGNQNWDVWDDGTRSLTELDEDNTSIDLDGSTVGTVTTLTGHTPQTGDSYARLGAPAGASVSADIAAIEAQTDDIGAAGAGLSAIPWNSSWDAEVESEVDDSIGGGTGTALTAIPWNAAWDAEVNAQVSDVLKTDTISEMSQGAPPGSPTIEQAVNYLYKAWRNKNMTDSSTIEVYDDAGTTVLFKSSISDDGTDFTKGEYVTGP